MVINLLLGDITKTKADAIVNAANTTLLGGGGVDGAIHRAGGIKILEECKKIIKKQGGCGVGEAVITTAGNLPAKFVIHTVGPIWYGGINNEDQLLANAYKNCLQLAIENEVKKIAFPNISTGVYNFPKERAAKIAIRTVFDYFKTSSILEEIIFVCFDRENYSIYEGILNTKH